jgi:transposase
MKRKAISTDPKPRRQYDAEFKASAVQMIVNGRSVTDVSRSLGVSAGLLHKWKSASEAVPVRADQTEMERLLRYVRQLEMERDVLEKALSIFSRTT